MSKYVIRYNVIVPHEIEVDTDGVREAQMKSRFDYFPKSDILQDFSERMVNADLSNADVEFEGIYDEDGDFVTDSND